MTDIPPEGLEAALTLAGYYADMVADRRRHERDDLTWSLLQAEIDGDRLTDDEVIGFLFLLVVAGNETTTKLLGNAWYWGWRNPDQRGQAAGRPGPGAGLGGGDAALRHLDADAGAGDQPAGARAGRRHRGRAPGAAAARLGQPGRGRLPRRRDATTSTGDTQDLVSFGSGRHFCMGAALARMEARVALTELVERVQDYDIDPAGIERVHSINVRGFAALPDHGHAALMPRFEPHPAAPADGGDRRLVGHRRRATARALAAAGHPVVLGARRVEVCEEVAAAIRAEGGEAVACHLDLADPASVDRFAKEAEAAFGPVEILVSNAARTSSRARRSRPTPEDFEEVLRVNVGGAQRLVRAFGAGMVERRRGDLVFVTSDVVAHPRPRMAAYVASKWGLEGFVTALQMELEGTGVRAVIVRPGPDADRHGHGLGPRGHRRGAGRVDAAGAWPGTRPSCAPRAWRRPSPHAVAAPAGHAPERGGGPAGGAARRPTRTTEGAP